MGSTPAAASPARGGHECYTVRCMAKRRGEAGLFQSALAKQRSGLTLEAVALYQRAIRSDPGAAEAHNNLGCALLSLGRLEDAVTALTRAVELRPGYAEALDTLGVCLAELGRPGEAVPYLERAYAAAPDSVATAFHLGNALMAVDRLAESRAAFERALQLEPCFAPAHNGLGATLARASDPDAAAGAFRAALAIEPAFGDAACNLGRVLLEGGAIAEAVVWFERAIEIDPANSHYYLQLVRSRAEPLEPHRLTAMEALSAPSRGLSAAARIDLHFGLAKVYEDAGRYDDAFRHLAAGNALKRAEVNYSEAAELGFFSALKRTIDPALVESLRTYGNPAETPVFVFSMARAGSTLVEQILAAHPAVAAAGEIAEFGRLIAEVRPAVGTAAPLDEVGRALRTVGDRYLDATARLTAGKPRLTDKTLANFSLAPLIHMALPNARMIHVRRNWLDTCFSCYATLFLGSYVSFSYDLAELGRYYRAYDQLMTRWRAILPPDRFLEVQYEDVVADLENQARRIVAFCGLPWDDACLSFHTARRPVRTASAFQVRQPLYDSAIGRAQRFAAHLAPLITASEYNLP
jgi:tetratricopeptide (TPR) repeat protein